jgi:hypothetical protein
LEFLTLRPREITPSSSTAPIVFREIIEAGIIGGH